MDEVSATTPLTFEIPAPLAGRPRPAPRSELMIKAADDAQAIAAWLDARASRSSATTESYKKEIEATAGPVHPRARNRAIAHGCG